MAIQLPVRGTGGVDRAPRFRLPTAADVPSVRPTPDPGVRVPAPIDTGLGDVGRALQDVGEVVQIAAERQQKRFDATSTTEAGLKFQRDSMEEFRRRQVEDDPSRPGFMGDFDRWLKEQSGAALTDLPGEVSEDARETFRLKLEESSLGMVDAAGRVSLGAAQKRAGDALNGQINEWSAQAERDPGAIDLLLGGVSDGLAPFSGTMTPDQERDTKAAARSEIIKGGLIGMTLQGDLVRVEALLASGKYDEDLTRQDRASVRTAISSARSERVRLAEKAEADAKEAITEEADQALKDFYALDAPTMQDVEALRTNEGITPAEFKGAREAVTKPDEGVDDPQFMMEVMPRIAEEDLTLDLALGLAEGRLTTTTYRSLITQNRNNLKDVRPASPYKSGREVLSIGLDPGQFGGDATTRQPLAIARANALADYDTWAEANPTATRPEAFAKARELTDTYENFAFDELRLALPRPRGFSGRKKDVTAENVISAQTELRSLIESGELTRAEAAREIQSLQVWERILREKAE